MARAGGRRVKIGLVNNMPDPALVDTDRQFTSLVAESLKGAPFEMVRLHLTSVERHPPARTWRDQRSVPVDLPTLEKLDALIITGAEPKTADLQDELYWPELTQLIDQALTLELKVLCSCLASHAAVQHLTGVKRRRRESKLSGVLAFDVRPDHPLARDLAPRLTTPHSRWNALDPDALERTGAMLLSVGQGEADAFTLPLAKGWLLLQGHPEYEPDTLVREFRRDLLRFQSGQIGACPSPPGGVFSTDEHQAFERGDDDARAAALIAACDRRLGHGSTSIDWRDSAVSLYRAWLGQDMPFTPAKLSARTPASTPHPRQMQSRRP